MTDLLRMENISKSFGKVKALQNVDFQVNESEIVGLVGDNGAGKSTLIKILMGVIPADGGEIYFQGEKLENHSPEEARSLGIEPVYQNQALSPKQTLWRNVFLGREHAGKFGFLDVKKQKKKTRELMKERMSFSSDITPDSRAEELSGGERQGLAISRALYFDASLVILDEPTTALSVTEIKKVLDFVGMIKERGSSCIFISHDIKNVYEVADRIVILDRGEKVDEVDKDEISEEKLTEVMLKFARRR